LKNAVAVHLIVASAETPPVMTPMYVCLGCDICVALPASLIPTDEDVDQVFASGQKTLHVVETLLHDPKYIITASDVPGI